MFEQFSGVIRRVSVKLSIGVVGGLVLFAIILFGVLIKTHAATQVSAPVFSISNASITTLTKVTLSSGTTGASIYYTYARGSTPPDPVVGASGTYLYNSSKGIDIQMPEDTVKSNGTSNFDGGVFVVGTYNIKAMATKSGYINSTITKTSLAVSNADQSSRSTLKTNVGVGLNKDSCWIYDKHGHCTSLLGMRSATFTEIQDFAKTCDKLNGGTGSTNKCGVVINGGTEFGHVITGTCRHNNGYKFDMSYSSSDLVTKYITNPTYFTKSSTLRDGKYTMYIRKSNGNTYTLEGSHWDVVVPNGTSC